MLRNHLPSSHRDQTNTKQAGLAFYGQNFSYFEIRFSIQCKCIIISTISRTFEPKKKHSKSYRMAPGCGGRGTSGVDQMTNTIIAAKLPLRCRRHQNNKVIYFRKRNKKYIILSLIAFKWSSTRDATANHIALPRTTHFHSRLHGRRCHVSEMIPSPASHTRLLHPWPPPLNVLFSISFAHKTIIMFTNDVDTPRTPRTDAHTRARGYSRAYSTVDRSHLLCIYFIRLVAKP